jgi:hypothetical protein
MQNNNIFVVLNNLLLSYTAYEQSWQRKVWINYSGGQVFINYKYSNICFIYFFMDHLSTGYTQDFRAILF